MTEQNREKQIDEMLESALATYSSVEPRPGLETRILANVREASAKKASWSWSSRWLGVGACAAALIVLLFFVFGHRQTERKPVVQIKDSAQPDRRVPVAPITVGKTPPKLRQQPPVRSVMVSRVEDASLPSSQRPAVFPTPSPLSEQERLLLSYVAGTPRDEIIAQSHPDEPPVVTQDQTGLLPDLTQIPQRTSNTQ